MTPLALFTTIVLAVALLTLLLVVAQGRWIIYHMRGGFLASQAVAVQAQTQLTLVQHERDDAKHDAEVAQAAYQMLLKHYLDLRLPVPSILPTLPVTSSTTTRPTNRLVAVFPGVGLDFTSEIENLRNLGGKWELVILQEENARREIINRELLVGEGCRILYLASHGGGGVVYLSDNEVVSKAWLSGLVKHYHIEVVIVNACASDELSLAVESAGALATVTTSEKIPHSQAIRFAAALLQSIAYGSTLERAVAYAKLNVTEEVSDIVRLRGDGGWKW